MFYILTMLKSDITLISEGYFTTIYRLKLLLPSVIILRQPKA